MDMTISDVWLLIKKIVVGILVFVGPLLIIAILLWFIQR